MCAVSRVSKIVDCDCCLIGCYLILHVHIIIIIIIIVVLIIIMYNVFLHVTATLIHIIIYIVQKRWPILKLLFKNYDQGASLKVISSTKVLQNLPETFE